ncbi:MAG: hypothetical protein DMF63_09355 [Acidobacteria bacterium]|nr:MAG: hypothetical protein DMF63_09355 [Acidobacteriota bacterium]
MAVATSRTVGEPDFCIAADDGRVFWVEAKTKTGKLSLEQLAAHAWLRRLGQSVYVVRNFGEFIQAAENKAEPPPPPPPPKTLCEIFMEEEKQK